MNIKDFGHTNFGQKSQGKWYKVEIVKNSFILTEDRMTGLIATDKQSILFKEKNLTFVALVHNKQTQ